MKDENNSATMIEFVGAKMYVVRVNDKKDIKKAKGAKDNVVARTITFDDYMWCLNEEIEMTHRQSCIRPKLHKLYTISESKSLWVYTMINDVVPDLTEALPWNYIGGSYVDDAMLMRIVIWHKTLQLVDPPCSWA